MLLQRTFQGLELQLKPRRASRFSGLGFLSVWLVFWVVGEVFAGGILLWGAWSLLTGQPPGAGREPLELAPALCTGLFLFVWLAFWTFGGVLAGHEYLRLLFGTERLRADADGFTWERNFGLFTKREHWARADLRRFYTSSSSLALETKRGVVDLTSLSTAPERNELATELNAEFGLEAQPSTDGSLTKDWQEIASPEGETILIREPIIWRKFGMILAGILSLFALVWFVTIHASWAQPGMRPLAFIVGAATLALAWSTHRVLAVRDEWVIAPHSLHFQKRVRRNLTKRVQIQSIHLIEDRDSDGDPWPRLVAKEIPAAVVTPRHGREKRHSFGSRNGDPTELRNLARWLQRRTGIGFTDHTTAETKREDYEALTRELAQHGRFGRWAARLMAKSSPR